MSETTRPVRVRVAPSPTGNCHVGTARSALFNLLVARQHQGTLVLRIDDTDLQRSTKESEQGILDSLAWLGLHWDEGPDVGGPFGPYRQSERLDLYNNYAEQLLDTDRAYRCFCTPAELAMERKRARAKGMAPRYSGRCRHLTADEVAAKTTASRPYVVRLRLEPKAMTFVDLVQGRVVQDAALMSDPVIVKSDGMPTYHFATVVDEHEMQISHVIRGVEHLNNTFPQLQMYEALGFDPPEFAHIGLLLNPNRSKISKRTGAVFVGEFRELGYLPEAMINHLALSGWSPGTDQEIFSLEELLAQFSLDRCSSSNAVYDRAKLLWLNGMHIRRLPLPELTQRILPFISEAGLVSPDNLADAGEGRLEAIIALEQERMKTLDEAPDLFGFFYRDPEPVSCTELLSTHKYTRRHSMPSLRDGLVATKRALEAVPDTDWTTERLASTLDNQVAALGWKRGGLFMAVRIAVSGRAATPSLFETLELIGREGTLRRLANALIRLDLDIDLPHMTAQRNTEVPATAQ